MKKDKKVIIKLDSVSYRHNDNRSDYLISNISVEIREGEKIAITGGRGSGKTTLLRLLAGHLTPSSGPCHKSVNCFLLTDYSAQLLNKRAINALKNRIEKETIECLLLDEPTEFLNRQDSQQVRENLLSMANQYKIAIVAVTNDKKLISLCDTEVKLF